MKWKIELKAKHPLRFGLISLCIFLAIITFPGCGGVEKVEDIYELDYSHPEYGVRRENVQATFYYFEDISQLSPQAQDVYIKIKEEGDIAGALEVLYQDMLSTDPSKEDQLFFYAPKEIFDYPPDAFMLYRDASRKGWSDDEKAAADLMIGLTYEWGSFPSRDFEVTIPGIREMARETYEEITRKYPDNKIVPLAKLALATWGNVTSMESIEKVKAIREEIAEDYPDSVYVTKAQAILASSYSALSGDILDYSAEERKEFLLLALEEYKKVLELPNYVVGFSTAGVATDIHSSIRRTITDLEEKLSRMTE